MMGRPVTMKAWILIDSPERLAAAFIRRLEREYAQAARRTGSLSLAVPGGSTMRTFFPALPGADVNWERVDVFWTDERAVPPDDPNSNYRLARELWLEPAGVPSDRVHRIAAERGDLAAAALAYERTLLARLGDPPRLDLVLCGVGPDGHICSLFPSHPATSIEDRWVVAVEDAPKPPPRRITLTLSMLAQTGALVFAAFGKEKAAVVREAIRNPSSALPVARAARAAREVSFLLDEDSAAEL